MIIASEHKDYTSASFQDDHKYIISEDLKI